MNLTRMFFHKRTSRQLTTGWSKNNIENGTFDSVLILERTLKVWRSIFWISAVTFLATMIIPKPEDVIFMTAYFIIAMTGLSLFAISLPVWRRKQNKFDEFYEDCEELYAFHHYKSATMSSDELKKAAHDALLKFAIDILDEPDDLSGIREDKKSDLVKYYELYKRFDIPVYPDPNDYLHFARKEMKKKKPSEGSARSA
ncbi:hypothetical protein N9L18_01025 [Candidatus Pacebacteria bacterium]|nr:hypothetical protein [Candidatus Paceibacterota bacterium]